MYHSLFFHLCHLPISLLYRESNKKGENELMTRHLNMNCLSCDAGFPSLITIPSTHNAVHKPQRKETMTGQSNSHIQQTINLSDTLVLGEGVDTISSLGNGVCGFSWSTETREGRNNAARRNWDSDVFRRPRYHLRGQTGNVNSLRLVLVGSWDDLVYCQQPFCQIIERN